MLSFELSVIDVVLAIAIIILLVLLITQKTGQTATKSRLHLKEQEKLPDKPEEKLETTKEENFTEQPSKGFQECLHEFGYLKDLPYKGSVPDECFGCPKVMRCLFPDAQNQVLKQ